MQVFKFLFRPILAMVTNQKKFYIVAYGGEERRTRGQILFIDSDQTFDFCVTRSLSWSPDGTFSLAFQDRSGKTFDYSRTTIKLCKHHLSLCIFFSFNFLKNVHFFG
jgi:hypothetical protein